MPTCPRHRFGYHVDVRTKLLSLLIVFSLGFLIDAMATSGDEAYTVLITGSNRGIGLEFARQYANRGWQVIATCRTPSKAEALQNIARRHANLRIEQLDVTDHDRIESLAAELSDTPIDVLINNAALLGERADQALGRLDYDLFERIYRVNAIGPMKMIEAFTPHVRASRQKKFVTLGSAAGSIGMIRPPADFYEYRASKAALHLLMKNTALDMRNEGILVAVISPGLVDTRGLLDLGPDDPVPEDFRQIIKLIRAGTITMITPTESVSQILTRIDELTADQTAVLLNYDGQILPW